MQRAEKKLAVLQRKIKNSKTEVNLQKINLLKKLCDGEVKNQRIGVIVWVLIILFIVVLVIMNYQTSMVSLLRLRNSRFIYVNFSVYWKYLLIHRKYFENRKIVVTVKV